MTGLQHSRDQLSSAAFAVAPERAVSCYSVPPQSPHPLTKPPQLPSLLLLHHVLQTLSKPAEKCHASPEHNTATHRIRSSSFSTLAKVATLFFNKYKCPGPPCKRQTDRQMETPLHRPRGNKPWMHFLSCPAIPTSATRQQGSPTLRPGPGNIHTWAACWGLDSLLVAVLCPHCSRKAQ